MSVRDLLKQLSQESDYSDPLDDVSESTVEDVVEQSPVAEMVLHAHQAEEVADQLNELAEKAEEVAEQDKEYLVNELSTEMMHMCYRNIMTTAGLPVAAHSFESNYDSMGKVRGLANDARHSAQQMSKLHDSILDFSPEGVISRALGIDRNQIKQGYSKLQGNMIHVNRFKELDERPVRVTTKNLYEFFVRDGAPVNDIGKEIIDDVNLLIKTDEQIRTGLEKLIRQLRSNEIPSNDPFGQFDILNTPLLGNRMVMTGDPKTFSTWGIIKAIPGWVLRYLGYRIVYMVVGGMASLVVPPLGFLLYNLTTPIALATAGYAASKSIDARREKENGVSTLKTLSQAYTSLNSLKDILSRSRVEVLFDEVSELSKNSESKREIDGLVKNILKLNSGVYEHALYILNKTTDLSIVVNRGN